MLLFCSSVHVPAGPSILGASSAMRPSSAGIQVISVLVFYASSHICCNLTSFFWLELPIWPVVRLVYNDISTLVSAYSWHQEGFYLEFYKVVGLSNPPRHSQERFSNPPLRIFTFWFDEKCLLITPNWLNLRLRMIMVEIAEAAKKDTKTRKFR
jgi:hypothetical protein